MAVIRSVFVAAQTAKCGRRQLDAVGKRHRFRKVVDVGRCCIHLPGCTQLLQGCPVGQWGEECDGASAICDLDGFTLFDPP